MSFKIDLICISRVRRIKNDSLMRKSFTHWDKTIINICDLNKIFEHNVYFMFFSILYLKQNTWLFIYINYESCNVLLLIMSHCSRLTQTHCNIASRRWTIKRENNKSQNHHDICAERNEQLTQRIFIYKNIYR